MHEPQVQHESMSLPGYWRITNFGRLTSNPLIASTNICISTYLVPLPDPGRAPSSTEHSSTSIRHVFLPIGEIPRVHLNAVFKDGVLVKRTASLLPFEATLTRSVDCTRSNIQVFRRKDLDYRGVEIIPVRENWENQSSTSEQQSLFIAFGSQEDRYATIIPAIEVFRFFYATSDVLAKAVIKGQFLDPNTHLWDLKKTTLSPDGHAVLWLRRLMLDADARFLARFAFDPYALKQAQDIFLFAAADMEHNRDRLIKALPPFEGLCTLKFRGIDLGSQAPNRVLVTRLMSCDWTPAFSHLLWDRDNDGRPSPGREEESDPPETKPSFYDVPSDKKPGATIFLSSSAPSTPSPPTRLREEEIGERFPELTHVPADKLPQEKAKTPKRKKRWIPIRKEAYKGSVVEGRSSSDYIGRMIIEGLEDLPNKPPRQVDDVDPTIGQKGYLQVLKLLRAMADEGLAKVGYLTVLDDISKQHNTLFNVFPDELDGKRKAWLFTDKDENFRRMALVAEINLENRVRYIIELQERQQKGCSTLVAWNETERPVPPGLLSVLVMDCAKQEGTTLSSADYLRMRWKRLHHTDDEDVVEGAKNFLARIFTDRPSGKPKENKPENDQPSS